MGKLKDIIIKQEEHAALVRDKIDKAFDERRAATHRHNASRHKQVWYEDMPDLEGQALAAAEEAFNHWVQLRLDLWEGEHGVGSSTLQDEVN